MPKKVDHEARREAFLQAAGRLIRRDGLAGLTVRAVAREAGFTTGALVHYVNSIDDLLVEAFAYAGRGVRNGLAKVEAQSDPLTALRETLYLLLPAGEDQLGHWTYWLGFGERAVHNATLRRITHMHYANWHRLMQRHIRRVKQGGAAARDLDVAGAARSAIALVEGLAVQVLRSGHPPTMKQQRAMIDDWIRFWLRPPRAIAGPKKPRL